MEYSADDSVQSRAACGSKWLAFPQSSDLHVVSGSQVLDWITAVRNSKEARRILHPASLQAFIAKRPDNNIREQ